MYHLFSFTLPECVDARWYYTNHSLGGASLLMI